MKNESEINPKDRAMAHYWRREIEVLNEKLAKENDAMRKITLAMAIAEANLTRLDYVRRITG